MRKCVGRGEGKARDSGFALLIKKGQGLGLSKKDLDFLEKIPYNKFI